MNMKWLTSLFCALFLASMIVAVPSGCSGSNEATEIDASQFDEDAANDEDEMADESEDDDDGSSDAGEINE